MYLISHFRRGSDYAYVDSKGFLIEVERRDSVSSNPVDRMPSWVFRGSERKPLSTKWDGWIDNKWTEVRFHWDTNKSSLSHAHGLGGSRRLSQMIMEKNANGAVEHDENICIHFSIDNWKPDQMQKNAQTGHWEIYRVLPPGPHYYYFSFPGEDDGRTKAASDQGPVLSREDCVYARSWLPRSVQYLNYVHIHPRKGAFNLNHELPRRPWYGVSKIEVDRIWTLDTSLFKERLKEVESRDFWDAKAYQSAFEHDWVAVLPKLAKFVKLSSQRDELKLICAKHFPVLRDCFRYYSAEGGGTDPFSMTLLCFTDFCQDCDIIDNEKCNLSAMDTIFIAANFEIEKNDDNPDHALERPEWLEAITRVAIAKFPSVSPAEALDLLMQKHVIPDADRHACDEFRTKMLYSEHADQIFRKHEQDIRAVVAMYGKTTKRLDGQLRPSLSFEAFLKVLQDGNLFDIKLSLEKAKFCFVNSKFTVFNESSGAGLHLTLSAIDFMEALTWVYSVRNPKSTSVPFDTDNGIDGLEDMVGSMLEGIRENNKAMRYTCMQHPPPILSPRPHISPLPFCCIRAKIKAKTHKVGIAVIVMIFPF
jgi:hypothetical protein